MSIYVSEEGFNDTLEWSFGLRNFQGKYLTAESFGYRINANGNVLKKKQIFFLEHSEGNDKVFIRTHLGRYLTATASGDFGADAEGKSPSEELTIEAQPDGRWALKTSFGYYAGGVGEGLSAYTKEISEDRLWTVVLAMHPQVCIRNVNRSRYVHLNGDTLSVDEDVPWGDDAMISFLFFEDGTYGLQACNGRWLSASGVLKDEPSADCRFTLEFHGGEIALKAQNNLYLTCLGGAGTLTAAKSTVHKDELFVLEDSHPQIKMTAFQGKKVSYKQGIELTANQTETTDTEIFQIEINPDTKQWSFRTQVNRFWTIGANNEIKCDALSRGANEWFDIEWLGPNVAIRAANGKYVNTKKNGKLVATADAPDADSALFVYELVNRPKLVLRGANGFVGVLPSGKVECNKSKPTIFNMHVSQGYAKISTDQGKYFKVTGDGVMALSDEPELYTMEFVELSKFMLKAPNGCYFEGFQNGAFRASGTSKSKATMWEF